MLAPDPGPPEELNSRGGIIVRVPEDLLDEGRCRDNGRGGKSGLETRRRDAYDELAEGPSGHGDIGGIRMGRELEGL